jgi:hypothetical protein
MTIDVNNLLANALLDRFDTEFPAGSILELRTGAPAGAENAAGGSLLCSITLPATPWATAASGTKSRNGTWAGTGSAAGNAGHYRLRNAAGTRIIEGTVTLAGAGGDATVSTTAITNSGAVSVTSFSYSVP